MFLEISVLFFFKKDTFTKTFLDIMSTVVLPSSEIELLSADILTTLDLRLLYASQAYCSQ